MTELLERMRTFVAEFVLVEEDLPLEGFPGKTYHVASMQHPTNPRWHYDHTMCHGSFDDFNRDIIHPGYAPEAHEKLDTPGKIEQAAFMKENGILYIRMDDDFFVVASLPYEFKDLSIQEIVGVVWPHAENPRFNPDSGDVEAWRKIWADPEHPTMVQLKGPPIKH